MLSIVISYVVADLLHEFHTLAAHIQYLAFGFILSGLLTIAIIHRIFENAIGYKAVSGLEGYVDASDRQRKKKPQSVRLWASNEYLLYLDKWVNY